MEHVIKQIAVDSLIPYAMNARTHSDEQVTQIASSIRAFGFTSPLLTDGQNGIIAGHGRLMAAKKLGLEKVPCIELTHLSEQEKKALILADNKIALNSGWDFELLKCELENLSQENFNLELVGFDPNELTAIMFGEDLKDSSPDEYNGDSENKWQLLVEYDSENDLSNAYDQFTQRGIKCKIIQ